MKYTELPDIKKEASLHVRSWMLWTKSEDT